MREDETPSLDRIRELLEASQGLDFQAANQKEVYAFVERTLQQRDYARQGRAAKGLLRRYVAKLTGRSRAQVARLIQRYCQGEPVAPAASLRHRFARRYTPADVALLVTVDQAHGTLSGPATRKILEREFVLFGRGEFERLATISGGHMYNLRNSSGYRRQRVDYQETRPSAVSIGERRKPAPLGRPGFLRVDSVHQGDLDGVKGVYHINAVDEVTQWQIMGATPCLSEAGLIPVLRAMLEQFPFQLRGFHSDNGSEYINYPVAKLLGKLLIEQTKSRPYHSNDNGLVEAKNGAVIRKHMGYNHIEAHHADAIQAFYREHLNPYVNFHRPCGQPEMKTDAKGKTKRVYRRYATPCEVFQQLPEAAGCLRLGQSMEALERQSKRHSDTQAAVEMQAAKYKLFTGFHRQTSHA